MKGCNFFPMKKHILILFSVFLAAVLLAGAVLGGCGTFGTAASAETASGSSEETSSSGESAAELSGPYENGVIDTEDLFTKRDLNQSPDLSKAVYETLSDNTDIVISEAGIYVISGSASEATVLVEAPDDAKVQIVLDGVSITNTDFPCIYVRSADKVFVTTISDSSLRVTGAFVHDGSIKTDGVIFSRSDLVLNGIAELGITSTKHGVVSKDDLKITGGTYTVTAESHAIEANDSVRIAGGTISLEAGKDAIHAENDEDDTLGYVYIGGGTLQLTAGDDGIHAISCIQIDAGSLEIRAAEGIEATRVQINGGIVNIKASDDGINAARKSASFSPLVEINGGDITISMGAGDTDGVDSNGDIVINGGTVRVTGSSTFDYEGSGVINGGTVICNGQQVTTLPNQMMGGMGQGGFPGEGWGGHGGGPGEGGEPPAGGFPGNGGWGGHP